MFTTCCCCLKMLPGTTWEAPVPTPQLYFPSSFQLPFHLSPSFPLCVRVQQAQADMGLPCAGHMQDRLGITLWTTWQNEREMRPKGRERWERADRTDEGWEHTDPRGRQREYVGSPQARLLWWQVEIIHMEDPSESSWAQKCFLWVWMLQGTAGGRRCWMGLALILAPLQNLAMI